MLDIAVNINIKTTPNGTGYMSIKYAVTSNHDGNLLMSFLMYTNNLSTVLVSYIYISNISKPKLATSTSMFGQQCLVLVYITALYSDTAYAHLLCEIYIERVAMLETYALISIFAVSDLEIIDFLQFC